MKALLVALLNAALILLACNVTYGEEIIKGHKAKKNSLRYMASVQVNNKNICGGFLIDEKYVLTAAHCHKRDKMSVVLGSHNISPQKGNLKRYAVERKIQHPSYIENNLDKGYDIMLLKLVKKVKQNEDTKILKISSKNKPLKPKTKCLVAGWGRTEEKKSTNDLMTTDVSIIDFRDCQKRWTEVDHPLPSNVICAGGYQTKSGACQGDSGGPLVCNGLPVGIVSFNYKKNCDYPNLPNIYTQISNYTVWINNIIKRGS